jgi:hypothetical protein
VRFSTSSLQRSAPTTFEPPAIATHCENALAILARADEAIE